MLTPRLVTRQNRRSAAAILAPTARAVVIRHFDPMVGSKSGRDRHIVSDLGLDGETADGTYRPEKFAHAPNLGFC